MPDDNPTFDILCGVAMLANSFARRLEEQGFRRDPGSHLKVIIDEPRGFAPYILETADLSGLRLITVTFSLCVEYWEDLWDLQPDALLVDATYEHDFAKAIARVSLGEQYQDTPQGTTPLTSTEREVLRYLARGWSNKDIAHEANLQAGTVANVLSTIYRKLGVSRREQAVMYYWGLRHQWENFTSTSGP